MNLRSSLLFVGAALAGAGVAFLCSTPTANTYTKNLPTYERVAPSGVSGNTPTKNVLHIDVPKNRTVFILGEIAENSADIVKQLNKLTQTQEPIYIVLNSPGGSVLDGAMIISALEAAKGPVYTVCQQLCASMAALIFEYGSQRYIVDRSFVMFHPAAGGTQGEVDKMVSRLGSIQQYIGRMEAYVAKRANISYDEYKKLSGNELWLDSENAVNTGFADRIVSANFPENTINTQVVSQTVWNKFFGTFFSN